jgi:cation:H+ antiporter
LEFVVAALVTLASSALLVTRIERVGARLRFTEAILGLVAALAANAPEITSAVTALVKGQRDIGVGVVLGSNVFNLAALLGLGGLVAGRINLHRRVIVFTGVVALWIGATSLGAVTSVVPVVVALVLALVVFLAYVAVAAAPRITVRIGLPAPMSTWLTSAVQEEESELAPAIHPPVGDWRDAVMATGSLVVVVVSSVVMERSGSALGARFGWSDIVIGAVLLAGVTSLPNAVAAVYLAARGRGSAVLSEALNSNNLNVMFGFLLPAVLIGAHHADSSAKVVDLFYLGLTVVALALAYVRRGIGRVSSAVIIAGYVAFVAVIVH